MIKMKVSLIITAYNEPDTIKKTIKTITDPSYSGYQGDFELIVACPDKQTEESALNVVKELDIKNFVYIKDPGKKFGKGKPTALNLCFEKATGDFLIFTDGDVFLEKNAVKNIIKKFINSDADLVSGHPKSADSKNNFMGYIGHLLADAAHHKRTIELTPNPQGKSTKLISKIKFFPVSGYLWGIKRSFLEKLPITKVDFGLGILPENTLVDDAYISYLVYNQGGKLAYAEDAIVYVKYPTNLKDYMAQKKRSTGGYVQLWEFGVIKKETKTRSFKKELEYFWFPLIYATNIKELLWSSLLYPIRLWLWIMIYWERRILKKDFIKTWTRIESTK
jgi:cellulose synthase/poly-beta-1,6-N-acetylglucosamine synthase-like glycosyltransferase